MHWEHQTNFQFGCYCKFFHTGWISVELKNSWYCDVGPGILFQDSRGNTAAVNLSGCLVPGTFLKESINVKLIQCKLFAPSLASFDETIESASCPACPLCQFPVPSIPLLCSKDIFAVTLEIESWHLVLVFLPPSLPHCLLASLPPCLSASLPACLTRMIVDSDACSFKEPVFLAFNTVWQSVSVKADDG